LYTPPYVDLFQSDSGKKRIDEAIQSLSACCVCPWHCEINRLKDQMKVCQTGRYAWISSFFPHFGEEDCLRGTNGSGTIFFSWCNLRCVFCQNFNISHQKSGRQVTPLGLANIMLQLQSVGCHNINWVTPEHVVPQILESLPIAVQAGLKIPIVYNTSAFDSMESIKRMEGIVDIYMPDFKYWTPLKAKKYLKNQDYPKIARETISEMYRQVGDLQFDENGLAIRGLLIRHLVMPGEIDETRKIMQFIAENISPNTYVNIMGQYYPSGKVQGNKYPEINRTITPAELSAAFKVAREAGLSRFDQIRSIHLS
jgi:putative pyruvate formate lyase activating enzyme